MTGPGLLAAAGTALLLGAAAAGLAPRLTARWIPHRRGGWPWPARLSVGAATAGLTGLLMWQHQPTQSAGYLLLAAWLAFTTAGVVLSLIDIVVRRLPTPIITGTAATIVLLLAGGAALTRRPAFVVVPVLAAVVLGGGYLLLAVLGLSSAGMGDVRLAALTGLLLGTAGWHTVLYGAFIPYLLAAPFALAAHRRHACAVDPAHIPFGPFLVGGALLAGLIGPAALG
jgi:leader peptidase (prepilin peptidase)/N-methyltransferase